MLELETVNVARYFKFEPYGCVMYDSTTHNVSDYNDDRTASDSLSKKENKKNASWARLSYDPDLGPSRGFQVSGSLNITGQPNKRKKPTWII